MRTLTLFLARIWQKEITTSGDPAIYPLGSGFIKSVLLPNSGGLLLEGSSPRLCSVHLLVRVWEGPKLLTCDRGCLYFWGQELQLLGTRACITLQWEWGTAFNMFNCKAAASHCRNVCFFRLCFFFFSFFVSACAYLSLGWHKPQKDLSLPWLENPFSIVLRRKRIENLNATGRSQMNRSSYPLKEWRWWGANTWSCYSLGGSRNKKEDLEAVTIFVFPHQTRTKSSVKYLMSPFQ